MAKTKEPQQQQTQKHESWVEVCARNAKFDILGYITKRYREALSRDYSASNKRITV